MFNIKRIISLLAVIIIIAASSFLSVSAAGSTSISLSKKTLNIGDTVTVSITLKATEEMYATEGYLDYDVDVLKFESGSSASPYGASSVKIVGTPAGAKSQTYSLKFKAIAAGNAGIKFRDVSYVADDLVSASGASVVVSVVDKSKSENADLSSLRLSNGTLSPKFSASTTNYTALVANSVTSCSIYANTADDSAKVNIAGNKNFKVGKNTCTVTVTSPSGKTKTYTIVITRGEAGEEVDSSDTSSTDGDNEVPSTAMDVTVGEENFTVVTDISSVKEYSGFEKSKVTYNDTEVPVLKSTNGDFEVFVLENKETKLTDFYTYDEITNTFALLSYTVSNERLFVFADDEVQHSVNGYYKTYVNLGNTSVKSYVSNQAIVSDFYIIYCYVDGKYGYYSYDSVEETLQRSPDFSKRVENSATQDQDTEVMTSLADFNKISNYGKAVILILGLIILCVVALVVLVIVRFIKLRTLENEELDLFDDGDSFFDEINVEDNSKND